MHMTDIASLCTTHIQHDSSNESYYLTLKPLLVICKPRPIQLWEVRLSYATELIKRLNSIG